MAVCSRGSCTVNLCFTSALAGQTGESSQDKRARIERVCDQSADADRREAGEGDEEEELLCADEGQY